MVTLVKTPSDGKVNHRIAAFDQDNNLVFTVWADSVITVNNRDLPLHEMKEAVVIAENFNLFYRNIRVAENG